MVVPQFEKEAVQTRDYCVAKTRRSARPAQILRCAKNACSGWQFKLRHYRCHREQAGRAWRRRLEPGRWEKVRTARSPRSCP